MLAVNSRWLVGSAAAVCTTVAFVPQLIKTWRHGGHDLSYAMLFLYLVGVSLWLAYGLIIDAGAVIVANAAAVVLVSACTVAKWARDRWPVKKPGDQ
jgi:MtN3 and saliva related transmembrane protein